MGRDRLPARIGQALPKKYFQTLHYTTTCVWSVSKKSCFFTAFTRRRLIFECGRRLDAYLRRVSPSSWRRSFFFDVTTLRIRPKFTTIEKCPLDSSFCRSYLLLDFISSSKTATPPDKHAFSIYSTYQMIDPVVFTFFGRIFIIKYVYYSYVLRKYDSGYIFSCRFIFVIKLKKIIRESFHNISSNTVC